MSSLGGFETESDIEARRLKRQEEWEKVRTADQPERKELENFCFSVNANFSSCSCSRRSCLRWP